VPLRRGKIPLRICFALHLNRWAWKAIISMQMRIKANGSKKSGVAEEERKTFLCFPFLFIIIIITDVKEV
jgi:hypothetical protein